MLTAAPARHAAAPCCRRPRHMAAASHSLGVSAVLHEHALALTACTCRAGGALPVPVALRGWRLEAVITGVRSGPGSGSSERARMCQATSARETGFIVNRSLARTLPVNGPSVSLTGRSACQSRPLAASSSSIACRSLPTRPRLGTATVRKKRNSSLGPAPMTLSAGPMLAVLTQISRARGAESRIAVTRARASRWCRSGGEVMAVRGLWRTAKFGPAAATTTSAPCTASPARAGSRMSGAMRTSTWLGGGAGGVVR